MSTAPRTVHYGWCKSFEWSRLTINVVDFEEEFDFVVWRLPGKLVHGVNKLLQADASVVIFVKDVKDSFHKEGLKKKRNLS